MLNHFRLEALFLATFDDAPLQGIVIHDFRERRLEAGFMHTAVTGAHSVGKAVHGDFEARGWLERYFYLHAIFFLCHTDDMFEQGRTCADGEIPRVIG